MRARWASQMPLPSAQRARSRNVSRVAPATPAGRSERSRQGRDERSASPRPKPSIAPMLRPMKAMRLRTRDAADRERVVAESQAKSTAVTSDLERDTQTIAAPGMKTSARKSSARTGVPKAKVTRHRLQGSQHVLDEARGRPRGAPAASWRRDDPLERRARERLSEREAEQDRAQRRDRRRDHLGGDAATPPAPLVAPIGPRPRGE